MLLSTHILSEVELTCERVLIIGEVELRTDEKLAQLRSGDSAIVSVEAEASDVQAEGFGERVRVEERDGRRVRVFVKSGDPVPEASRWLRDAYSIHAGNGKENGGRRQNKLAEAQSRSVRVFRALLRKHR